MEKFKVNNFFVDEGKTLEEILSNFLISFYDDEFNDITNFDIVLRN